MLNPFSNKLFKGFIGEYMRPFDKIHPIFKPITCIGLHRQFRIEDGFGDRFSSKIDHKIRLRNY